MAKKVIDLEIKPDMTGLRTLNAELSKMRKELSEATDPDEINRLNKALKQTEKEIEGINKAADQFDLGKKFDDVYEGLAPLSSRLSELEDRMYELAFAGKANTEEFRALQKAAVEMRQTIIEVDKQVDILADNRGFSVFGDGIGEVGASLARLDFETANKQASTLASNAASISFGSAIKSVQQFGSTIINLGKAILANPLFLLVTIMAAIAYAIYELLDAMGVIKIVFEAVGAVIGWVVQQIKDFLDFLGLTNFAEQDAAEASAKAAEKRAKAYENASKRIVQALDTEIKIAELQGRDTEDLERRRLESIRKTSEAQLEAARERYRAERIKGDLDDEEMRDLRQQITDKRLEYTKALDDIKIFNVQVKVEREKAIEDQKKLNEEELEEQRQAQKDAYEEYKRYRDQRIAIEREIQDAELSLMQEGYDKELKAVQLQFDRLIEDAKNNEELRQSERVRLIELYGQQRLQAEEKVYDESVKADEERKKAEAEEAKKKKDEEQKRLDELVEFYKKQDALEIELMAEGYEKQKAERTAQFEDRIAQLEAEGLLTNEVEIKLRKQLQADLDAIQAEADKKEKERKRNLEMAKAQMAIDGLALVAGAAELFSEKSERAAKIAFNLQKASGIAQATIDGYKAVLSAYSGAPVGFKLAAAAIAAGFSAVQIANIAKTRFEGGGGATAGNLTGGAASAQPQIESATPNVQLFGQANGLNTFFQAQGQEQQTVQAVISLDQFNTSKDKAAQIYENGLL